MSNAGAICCFQSAPTLCCFEAPQALCCFEAPEALCCFDAENHYNMNTMMRSSAWCGKPLHCDEPCMGDCEKRSDVRKPVQIDWMRTSACMNGEQCVAQYRLKTVTHEILASNGDALAGEPEDLFIALEADNTTLMEYVECGAYQSQVFLEGGAPCTQYMVVATATWTDCGREWTDKRCFKVWIQDSF